jgi:hypothetical protein
MSTQKRRARARSIRACLPMHPPPGCQLGSSLLTPAVLREELAAFVASGVLSKRPVAPTNRFNSGGTGLFHAFYLWVIARHLKPLHVVESGAFQGLGTWILRQAAPQAQLIVLSPNMPALYVDRQPTSRYFTGKLFRDFAHFDWDCLGLDKARTLIFFDDHQSGYRRVLEAQVRGFQHLMFDDNYLPGAGDNFSPKAACAAAYLAAQHRNASFRFADFRFHPGKPRFSVTSQELQRIHQSFVRVARRYQEIGPLWAGPNRHGLNASGIARTTQPPLLTPAEIPAMYRSHIRAHLRAPEEESKAYTFFSYVHADPSASQRELFWPPRVGVASHRSPFYLARWTSAQCFDAQRNASTSSAPRSAKWAPSLASAAAQWLHGRRE